MRGALVSLLVGVATLSVSAHALAEESCPDIAERGQDLRARGKLIEARKEFLTCAQDRCPAVIQRDCSQWFGELEGSTPSLLVLVRARGKDVAHARVWIDGTEQRDLMAPRAVDPGTHEVRVEANGFAKRTDQVTLRVGERNRAVVMDLAATTEPQRDEHVTPPATGPSYAGPIVAGAAGVLGLGAFGVGQLLGRLKLTSLEDGCGRTASCSPGELSAARIPFVVSGIGLGVGVVGVAVAVAWYLLIPSASPKAARLPLSWQF